MEYGQIVSESFRIAWRNKSLWVLGFFAGWGSIGFNIDPSYRDMASKFANMREVFESTGASIDSETLVTLLIVGGFLWLGFMAIHLISFPALIDGVNQIARGGRYSFGRSWSAGIDFFGRFFGLALIAILIALGGIGCGVVLGLILADVSIALLALLGLMLLPVAMAITFVLTSIYALTARAMVVRNIGLADAIIEGWVLFRRNFLKCLVIFLLYVGLSIGIVIGAGMTMAVVAIPLVLLAIIVEEVVVLAIALGALIGIPLFLALMGFAGTVLQNLYTLFYFRLVEPDGPSLANTTPAAPVA